MPAYAELQRREFRGETEDGYQAVRHRHFVGTGYFDRVAEVIAGGRSSLPH